MVLDNEETQTSKSETCDRFIPQRVHETSNSIYQVSQSNSHELEVINKCLKVFKKSSSENSAVPMAPPVARSQTFNDRGLIHQRLTDAVSHYTQHT